MISISALVIPYLTVITQVNEISKLNNRLTINLISTANLTKS